MANEVKSSRRVALVGAGKLATNLGIALKEAGYEIVCVYSRTSASATVLAERLECKGITQLEDLPRDLALYIVSVIDSALPEVIAALPDLTDAVVAHTAGSLPMNLLAGKALHYGVFYPMQTFSKEVKADFSKIPCFVEGSDEWALSMLRQVGNDLSPKVVELSSEGRRYLHLSAVIASNFANHCYAMAWRLTQQYNIPFEVLLPLIEETAAKVKQINPIVGQTGPAVRGDVAVMEAQMKLLENEPEMAELYRLLSADIRAYQEKYNV